MGEKRKEISNKTLIYTLPLGVHSQDGSGAVCAPGRKKKGDKLFLYLYGNIMNVKIQHLVCREWKDARKLHMQ